MLMDPLAPRGRRRPPAQYGKHKTLRLAEPKLIERELRKDVTHLVRGLAQIAEEEWERMMRVYGDRWNMEADSLILDAFDHKAVITVWKKRVALAYAQFAAETPQALVQRFTKQLDLFNEAQIGASFEAVVGVKPWLPPQTAIVTAATREGVDLITRMPVELLDRIEGKVLESVARGRRHEQFADVVKETLGVGQRRAELIARDQTAKLNSKLNEGRQKAAGVKEYIWSTVGDDRVVGTPGGMYPEGNDKHGDHFEREGKVFSWDNPPHDGHPGEAINCRCRALPVVDELLDKQDDELRAMLAQ